MVYTDAVALVSIVRKDDARGRIVAWQVRLAEYEMEPRHAKTKDIAIADGMARMPYQGQDSAGTRAKDWEDVRMANAVKRGAVTVEDVVDEYDAARERERPVDEPKGDEGCEDKVPQEEDINSEKAEETACRWSKWLEDE